MTEIEYILIMNRERIKVAENMLRDVLCGYSYSVSPHGMSDVLGMLDTWKTELDERIKTNLSVDVRTYEEIKESVHGYSKNYNDATSGDDDFPDLSRLNR
jgi:hypothetical protein